jgi:hypothetical protein
MRQAADGSSLHRLGDQTLVLSSLVHLGRGCVLRSGLKRHAEADDPALGTLLRGGQVSKTLLTRVLMRALRHQDRRRSSALSRHSVLLIGPERS